MNQTKKKTGPSGCLVIFGAGVATFAILGLITTINNSIPKKKLSPQEIASIKRKQVAEWYQNKSHQDCEDHLKKNLRNPDSYKRDGDIGILKDDGNQKTIIWKYRAENGFGGMNYSAVTCLIKNKNNGEYEVMPIAN